MLRLCRSQAHQCLRETVCTAPAEVTRGIRDSCSTRIPATARARRNCEGNDVIRSSHGVALLTAEVLTARRVLDPLRPRNAPLAGVSRAEQQSLICWTVGRRSLRADASQRSNAGARQENVVIGITRGGQEQKEPFAPLPTLSQLPQQESQRKAGPEVTVHIRQGADPFSRMRRELSARLRTEKCVCRLKMDVIGHRDVSGYLCCVAAALTEGCRKS
jgi:hypothetical protein